MTRRTLLGYSAMPVLSALAAAARPKIAVSTYSYWHFRTDKYPIEKVIENAAELGFDGVEILHRQMADETPAYCNKLKQLAFQHGLASADAVDPSGLRLSRMQRSGASTSSTRRSASTSPRSWAFRPSA